VKDVVSFLVADTDKEKQGLKVHDSQQQVSWMSVEF